MKTTYTIIVIILIAFIVSPSLTLAENLFKNSTMDTTSTWKGDRKYGTDGENRVLILKANARKTVEFYQDVATRKIRDLYIKFRYKTESYEGRGLQTRGRRSDGGSTFRNHTLNADGKWHEITWNFSEVRGSRDIRFSIELLEGEGEVSFDDVTIEAK